MYTIFLVCILDYNMFKYFLFLYIEIHKYTWHFFYTNTPTQNIQNSTQFVLEIDYIFVTSLIETSFSN